MNTLCFSGNNLHHWKAAANQFDYFSTQNVVSDKQILCTDHNYNTCQNMCHDICDIRINSNLPTAHQFGQKQASNLTSSIMHIHHYRIIFYCWFTSLPQLTNFVNKIDINLTNATIKNQKETFDLCGCYSLSPVRLHIVYTFYACSKQLLTYVSAFQWRQTVYA